MKKIIFGAALILTTAITLFGCKPATDITQSKIYVFKFTLTKIDTPTAGTTFEDYEIATKLN